MSLTRHGLPSSDKSIDFTCVDIGCGGINQVPSAPGLQCSMLSLLRLKIDFFSRISLFKGDPSNTGSVMRISRHERILICIRYFQFNNMSV